MDVNHERDDASGWCGKPGYHSTGERRSPVDGPGNGRGRVHRNDSYDDDRGEQ